MGLLGRLEQVLNIYLDVLAEIVEMEEERAREHAAARGAEGGAGGGCHLRGTGSGHLHGLEVSKSRSFSQSIPSIIVSEHSRAFPITTTNNNKGGGVRGGTARGPAVRRGGLLLLAAWARCHDICPPPAVAGAGGGERSGGARGRAGVPAGGDGRGEVRIEGRFIRYKCDGLTSTCSLRFSPIVSKWTGRWWATPLLMPRSAQCTRRWRSRCSAPPPWRRARWARQDDDVESGKWRMEINCVRKLDAVCERVPLSFMDS